MRSLVLVLCAACTSSNPTPTPLEGAISCGPTLTCGSGQICFSKESGSLCDVNADAGIGQYQDFGWTCESLPAECDGVTRDCFPGADVSNDGRYVTDLCI